MPGIVVATAATPEPAIDPRLTHARPHLGRVLALSAQLALLGGVFELFHVEESGFLMMAAAVFAGFLAHYWLPFRYKEPFWIALSMAGAFLLLEPPVAVLIIAAGLAFFVVLRSRLPYGWRLAAVAAAFAVLMFGCARRAAFVPEAFWPVFGSIFMFRMMVYLYELRYMKGVPRLRDYLSYFFLLPNYYFVLFPVIDFQTLRRSYYRRDIHAVAQQGIHWMVRGTVQLLLYRVVDAVRDSTPLDSLHSFGAVASTMLLTYLLYLRVSGDFHIVAGMLHLFGYDLPETHRRYLLARSLTDFWRRINIYWKDFMVKIVYFPVYFRLRKKGDVRAQLIGTAAVFVVTWALHSYQFFWIQGRFLLSWPDTIFWSVLGLLVAVNVAVEARRKPGAREIGWAPRLRQAVQTLATFALITTLWSLWSAPGVPAWIHMIAWWKKGV